MASNDEQRSATTIFTTAAQSIAARLIANKTTAKFTKAEISTTNLFNQSVTELQVLTSLDNVQQTADINTVTVINDSTVDVNIAIDQTKAPNDYQMNSVGLFAVDGDGKEVLYSVTVLKDPVYIHQDAMGSALGIDLETVVGQSSNVDLSINPAGAVTNEALKVTLADYVKTDDVEKLIPATVIDGSKPADFKEAVTLEKGAVDGAGNAIATAKNVSDGDAKTLTSAKEYADAQVGDKVKDADTVNWQKTKITGDDGGNKYSFTTANTTDLVASIQALPLGYHTFYCQAGVKGNPSSQAVRGIAEITTAGANPLGVGYLTDSTGDFWSFYVDSSGLKLKNKQDKLDYTPANAANVVDRNPNTGVVSEPVDFTKLTVNGGKTVASSDDLKSLEDASWHTITGNSDALSAYTCMYRKNNEQKYVDLILYGTMGITIGNNDNSLYNVMDLSTIVANPRDASGGLSHIAAANSDGGTAGMVSISGTKLVFNWRYNNTYLSAGKDLISYGLSIDTPFLRVNFD